MKCPNHNVELIKKEVVYGDPDPSYDFSDVVLGGCVVSSDSPRVAYECPNDKEVYVYRNGKLVKFEID